MVSCDAVQDEARSIYAGMHALGRGCGARVWALGEGFHHAQMPRPLVWRRGRLTKRNYWRNYIGNK